MTPIRATLLVLDGEPLVRWSLRQRFALDRYEVLEAGTPASAVKHLAAGVDLVLLDYGLPDAVRLAVLRRIKERHADTPVILMATFPSVASALEGKKYGVYHCVNKPFNLDDVALAVEQALETARLRREVRVLCSGQGREFSFAAIVGRSPAMRVMKAELARIVAGAASGVLLTGETGTGKRLAAKVLHYNSARAALPFVALASAGLSEKQLERELIHAHGGTVFLADVGDLPAGPQRTLLRLLDERAVTRVGGRAAVYVDVRIVAASRRDLEADVRAGQFREELFRHLQVMPVHVPPLRHRAGDVVLLSDHYASLYARELQKRVRGVVPEALALFECHHWPGNVRELRNAVERAALVGEGEWLEVSDFVGVGRVPATDAFRLPPEGVNLEALERQLLAQALERCGGNRTHAGRLLGINRDQVRYRVEKYGLSTNRPFSPNRRV